MEYRFCPWCGHALQMPPNHKKEKARCRNCSFVHYNNPRACVSAIIHRRNEILFVQRAHEPFKHYWDLPGGFLEAGELPEAGLRREIREELQIEIDILKLWNAYPDSYGPENTPIAVFYYLCARTKGAIHLQEDEISDAQWFTLEKPPDKLAFNHIPAVLADLRKR